jgi:RNA polymerase sigma-70 factor, ECF subfamily
MASSDQTNTLVETMLAMRRDLLKVARPFASSVDDAEDLVQAAYTRALERSRTIKHNGNLSAWLRRVVKNVAIDRHRQNRCARRSVPLGSVEVAATTSTPDAWRFLDEGEIGRAVSGLSPGLRETYGLHFRDGLSNTEIAARLGIPLATVGTRIHRVRTLLRRTFGPATEVGR